MNHLSCGFVEHAEHLIYLQSNGVNLSVFTVESFILFTLIKKTIKRSEIAVSHNYDYVN